eukprot:g24998.t1
MESSTRRSEARSSNLASLAFAPDTDALYDGRFHSRRFGAGTKVSEELVLGSTDQLLPLLLLPFARRQQNSTSRTPLPPLPGLGPRGKRLRVLCGSNVHVYPSDPLPEKQLLCSKVLADEQMDLWAVHVPTSIGSKKGAKSLTLSCGMSFVSSLISCLSGQLQGQACGASFNCGGINPTTCVPFLPCETFRASFLPRWASAASAASAAPGGSLGDLAGAVEYAVEVTFDRQQPISLEVEWKPHGKRQSSTKLRTDVGTWQKSWDDSEGLHLAVGAREAQLGSGFLVTPEAPTWQVTLRPDEVLEDRGQSGQCILFKGQLPRRDVWVDGEEYALQILEPPAVSLTDARLEHDWHWRRAVEIALALVRVVGWWMGRLQAEPASQAVN